MKVLMIVSGLALALVAGITVYATLVLDEIREYEASLRDEFETHAERLRDLDTAFPHAPRSSLDPARFAVHLEVRKAVADYLRRRLREKADRGALHGLKTRSEVVRVLADELAARRMGLSEYREISRRWHAILAHGEPKALRRAWSDTVTTREHPDGLPLPPPADKITPAERSLLAKHAEALRESLDADLLGPALDRIAAAGG